MMYTYFIVLNFILEVGTVAQQLELLLGMPTTHVGLSPGYSISSQLSVNTHPKR